MSVTPPTDIFNYNALPPTVKQRYDAYKDPNIITPLDLLTPLTWLDGSKHNYYEDPTIIGSRIILRNGAIFEGIRDHKRFTRQPPTCSNKTTSALRIWYRSFTNHALSCGYFIVPYELLDKLHGSNGGFEFGVDLPSSKTPEYFHWQNDISRILQQTGMFPVGSEYFNRVHTDTNGYHALLNLLHDTHPKYVSSPITLAPDWHQQPDQTLFEFYTEFTEIIRLRAIFMHGTQDFSSIDMVDLFIQRCTHSKYLTHLSRFDRHVPCKADLFKPGILQITLNNYLSEPDSPLKPSSKFRSGGNASNKNPWEGKSTSKPPYKNIRTVHAMGTDNPYEPYMDSIIHRLTTNEDLEYVIHRLTFDEDSNTTQNCLFCPSEIHRFKDCPIFNDDQFKSTLLVKLMSEYNRTRRRIEKESTVKDTNIKKIRQLLAEPEPPDLTLPPASKSSPPLADFPKGGK